MKDIIYLNNDFINSFISQAYDGLPLQKQKETATASNESGTDTDEENTSSNAGANVAFLSGKYNYGTKEISSLTTSESEETREIVEKKMYDNALNDLESLLSEKGRLKNDLDITSFGDYLKIETDFQIFDIHDFLKVTDNYTITAIKEAYDNDVREKEVANNNILNKIPTSSSNYNKEKNRLKKEVADLKKQKENDLKDTENNFRLMQAYINFLEHYLPTTFYFKSKNSIIPLEEKFLRESVPSLNFKYNNSLLQNKVVILGKVTKKVSNTNVLDTAFLKKDELKEIFNAMNNVFNEAFKLFDILNKDDYIISPIAVYFEDDLF